MSLRSGNPARLRALPRWWEWNLPVTFTALLAVPVVVARAGEAMAALRVSFAAVITGSVMGVGSPGPGPVPWNPAI